MACRKISHINFLFEMKKFLLLLLLTSIILLSCINKKADNVNTKACEEIVTTSIINGEIEIPRPPSDLTSPEEKAEFILMNFWNPVNFKDTALTGDEKFLEQNFVNFISLLPYTTVEARRKAVFKLLNKSEEDQRAYDKILNLAEKYLYDIHSPMLNEETFLPFMLYVSQSKNASDIDKEVADYTIENINKNLPGRKVPDFEFTDKEGKVLSLYSLFPDRDIILLFFDPDCEKCKNTIDEIKDNKEISQQIKEGKLSIVAIYSGLNIPSWRKEISSFPEEWIVGREPGIIDDNELYDLRSIPSIYFLNPDKTIIKKDYNFIYGK